MDRCFTPWWRLLLLTALLLTAASLTRAQAPAAPPVETLGWCRAAGESKEIEQVLPDFDPALTPVTVLDDPATRTVTREGQGWLEVIGSGAQTRRVLHLKGAPYDLGFEHGRLLAPQVRQMVSLILQVLGTVETLQSGKSFIDTLKGIQARCQPFIPAEYLEEARGLADGAGLSLEAVLLANIMPERFHCSGFALWGRATADGQLYHGRILDYMTQAGLQSLAVVIVYEPDGRIPWVNVSYAGFLGSVTGMNARQVAIGEMGGGGEGAWDGMPMSYLVRHALETSATLDEALKTFRETPRTCEYYYVVSDAKGPSARGLYATPARLDVIGPGEKHERLPNPVADAVLLSAGDRYKRLVMRTEAHYGQYGAPEALALMRRPVAMQSCLHAVLFRPADGCFWVANASADSQPASEQPYAAYRLSDLLKAQ